jgi:hypothetical protein
MALTGRFWFKRTWRGNLVLLVEDESRRWFGRRGATKRRWRDAKLLDLAEPELQALVNLERSRRSDRAPGSVRPLHAVPSNSASGASVPPKQVA